MENRPISRIKFITIAATTTDLSAPKDASWLLKSSQNRKDAITMLKPTWDALMVLSDGMKQRVVSL